MDESVDVDETVAVVPRSFLGLSQEWPWLGSLAHPDVVRLLRLLAAEGTGPLMMRVGGASADSLESIPSRTWDILNQLRREVGVDFILNLNLVANDPDLLRRQRDAALQALPSGSIKSFEIGNEPNYYSRRGQRPSNYLSYFPSEFRHLAEGLQCSNVPCSGPAWGHIYMQPSALDWFLRTNRGLLNLATVHFYKNNNETFNDPVTLLDEAAVRTAMASLDSQVQVSRSNGVDLRLTESNSISGGGLAGVSDSFSAALWTLDSSFEVLRSGAVGIDYHQGSRWYALSEQVQSSGGAVDVEVRAPFFGLLLFQKSIAYADSGRARLVRGHRAAGPENVKVWPVVVDGNFRAVLINKDANHAAEVTLRMNGGFGGWGRVTRLTASALGEKTSISLGGMTFDGPGAHQSGSIGNESIPPDTGSGYRVMLPAGSAALFEVWR